MKDNLELDMLKHWKIVEDSFHVHTYGEFAGQPDGDFIIETKINIFDLIMEYSVLEDMNDRIDTPLKLLLLIALDKVFESLPLKVQDRINENFGKELNKYFTWHQIVSIITDEDGDFEIEDNMIKIRIRSWYE